MNNGLSNIVSPAYLDQLEVNAAPFGEIKKCARQIHELFLRRQIIDLSIELHQKALNPSDKNSPAVVINQGLSRLHELSNAAQVGGHCKSFKNVLMRTISMSEAAHMRKGQPSGVLTGLQDLDDRLRGLHAGELIILAGRPYMGAADLARTIAFNAAVSYGETKDGNVAYFSLETRAEQIASQILAERAKIYRSCIFDGTLVPEMYDRMVAVAQELQSLNLFIVDKTIMSVSEIHSQARRLKRIMRIGLIVIDYLQLIDGALQGLAEVANSLKLMAIELDVPVLVVSLLPPTAGYSGNHPPNILDLGDEKLKADVVMCVHREQYYIEDQEPCQQVGESESDFNVRHSKWLTYCEAVHCIAEVRICKHPFGPHGPVRLSYIERQFADLR